MLRPPSRLPWRRIRVARIDMSDFDRGRLHSTCGRSWRLRPHLLADPGDAVHDGYALGLARLTFGASEHRLARIKTRWGRVIGIGTAVPTMDLQELPILEALGLDARSLEAFGRDDLVWTSWSEERQRPHLGISVNVHGRLTARIDLARGAFYRRGAVHVRGLPETVAMGAVGLPLASIIHHDRLARLDLRVRRVETVDGATAMHVLDPAPDDPLDGRLLILDDGVRRMLEEGMADRSGRDVGSAGTGTTK